MIKNKSISILKESNEGPYPVPGAINYMKL